MGEMMIEERFELIGKAIAEHREAAEKTVVKTASLLGISPDEYLKIESGEKAPSLPQMEALAYFFKVPFASLLEPSSGIGKPRIDLAGITSLVSLREKIISSSLKKARLDKGMSIEDLAFQTQLTVEDVNLYELNQAPIPEPFLENICAILDIKLDSLFSSITVQPKETEKQPATIIHDLPGELPLDLMNFIADPNNLPYLELARKLSHLNAAKIREIAESLLEITY